MTVDSDVAARFLAGDPATVAETIRLIRAAVSARGFYIPFDDRAEVTQEVLMQVWNQLTRPTAEPPRNYPAWVRTIAYRRCVDWMRAYTPAEPVEGDAEPAPGASPEGRVLDRERREIGARVLAALREPCRDLIRRYVVEGLTFREIAESTGGLEKTVRNRMYKCIQEARTLVSRIESRSRLGVRVVLEDEGER